MDFVRNTIQNIYYFSSYIIIFNISSYKHYQYLVFKSGNNNIGLCVEKEAIKHILKLIVI